MFRYFYKGNIKTTLQVNKNVFYNGETITIDLKIDSMSLKKQENLKLKVNTYF